MKRQEFKNLALLGSGIAAALALLFSGNANAQGNKNAAFELEKGRRVLEPLTFGSLSLLPIVAESPETKTSYLVLDEGMKSKKVKISEVSADGSVNELAISNTSSDPLFLMAGEVIIGGKQDRIIGKTMVVPAKTKQKVPVFCVEHGRWSGRKASFESTGALAHKSLRTKASFKDQGEVWKEVKSKNGKRKVSNKTDTYGRVATGKKVRESVKGFDQHFKKALKSLDAKQRTKHVGYVVALNGKVVSIEVFSSSALFRKLEGKLLRSYYVEAVDVAKTKNAKVAGAKEVRAFRVKAKGKAKKAKRVISGKAGEADAADTFQFDDEDLKGSIVKSKEEPAAPAVYEGTFN